jgi:hypothetical protein
MTNCDYVRHMGKKTSKDLSICIKTFKRITSEQWTLMCGLEGHRMTEAPKPTVLSLDQLRAARLARFTATAPVETNVDGVHRASGPEPRVD